MQFISSSSRSLTLVGIAALLTLTLGCKTSTEAQKPAYAFPTQGTAVTAATAWFDGDEEAAMSLASEGASVEELLIAAEATFWRGDVERAFELHAALLENNASHPLARFSAARLHDLHDDVIDFHDRIRPILAKINYGSTHPLTASYLSMIGQRVAWRSWHVEQKEAQFNADEQGLPLRWTGTPRLSTFRLGDFDRSFSPETEAQLAKSYTAPVYAEAHPSNIEDSQRYIFSNISLSPNFPGSGIYYMETFATVDSDKDEVYWVFGNSAGAMRLWIDGEEVFTRDEGDYGTGKRWRRVKLSPGTHRILVKLAYQSSYRDWFDLNFLNPAATAIQGSKLTFAEAPTSEVSGKVAFLSEVKKPSQLEPLLIRPDATSKASDVALYLTALAANYDREADYFDPAMNTLLERHPKFAAGHGLKSAQVKTLWEVPSKLRDANALAELRKAHELDPDSLYYTMNLANWLKDKGKDREVRELLEAARDGATTEVNGQKRLRHIQPLHIWARYLEEQGWDTSAEEAWSAALSLAPSDCTAASKVQSLRYERADYVEPSEITPRADACPTLEARWLNTLPESYDEKLALKKRDAARYPYDVTRQWNYAEALFDAGDAAAARQQIADALARIPHSQQLYYKLSDLALGTPGQGKEAAREWLEKATEEDGNSGWIIWRMATLEGDTPLADLMQDGPALAKSIATADPVIAPSPDTPEGEASEASTTEEAPASPPKTRTAGDEAYYAIDFAATHYLEDGASLTLTHTMVRVMNKSAIDRFAEVSIPGGARVLVARTVKQDGSTVVPEQTPGKETLSMPGLAPGDFIELAYLDFNSPSAISNTNHSGTRFFFKMSDISSLRSEFVVINPAKDFLRRNDAPEAQPFEYHGQPAVRFLRTDSPRPRSEPYSVSSDEFLPWVQMYSSGTTTDTFELGRRNMQETIRDSSKISRQVEEQFRAWLGDAKKRIGPSQEDARDRLVKDLFYQVNAYFTSHSGSMSQDISHAILTREGNPMVVLETLYQRLGFETEIYLVKDRYATPLEHPTNELGAYSDPVLYIKMPDSGEEHWVIPSNQDAMFGAISDALRGQPAVCITCSEASKKIIPLDSPHARYDSRDMDIEAELDAKGTLKGVATQVYDGPSANYGRALLRQQTEETKRGKFIEALLSEHIPGATVTNYEIQQAANPDAPLTFVIEFEREQFARVDGANLVLEAALFRQPVASVYGTLSTRTLPLMLGRARHFDDTLRVKLPAGMNPNLRSKSGSWSLDSGFGEYRRAVQTENGVLEVSQQIDVPVQRVETKAYPQFQQWAIAVEQSSVLLLELTK